MASTRRRLRQLLHGLSRDGPAAQSRPAAASTAEELLVPPEVTFDDLRHALTPRDPPQFPVGASAEALAEQMRVEGCCVLPALIQGAALERIQAAWLRVHDPIRREYAEAAAKGHGVSPGDARGRSFANSEELPPFHGETLTRNHFHIPPAEFCGLEKTGPLEPELLHLLAGRGCELVVDVIARYLGGPVRLTGIDPITATREEQNGGYVTWYARSSAMPAQLSHERVWNAQAPR